MAERIPALNRERLSIIIALILLALAAIPILNTADAPGQSIGGSVLGSALDIQFTLAGLVTLLAAGLACAGIDLLIRVHPRVRSGQAGSTFVFCILPALTVIAAAQWLAHAGGSAAWVAELIASGVAVWVIVQAEYATIDLDGPSAGRARLVLNVFAYLLAFGLFALIWETRARSLLTATLASLTAFLISVDLMRASRVAMRRVLLYSAIVALIIGECAWALNYWRTTSANAGLALVLIFYAVSGAALQHLFGKLTRRVALEFGVVIAAALILLFLGAPR
jgi:hypothetical protein